MNAAHTTIDIRYKQLKHILSASRKYLVAYSGGVDSTFLLKVLSDLHPSAQVLAVTAVSATSSRREQADAVRFAQFLGAEHLMVPSMEMELSEFTANTPHKCYICKQHRYRLLQDMAQDRSCDWIVDGENADDQQDFRPGRQAARELGVRSPLYEAGLTKADIRELSRRLDLPSWNKPALACLASRIPYHQPITAEKLAQVDQAETFLHQLGCLPQLRVRHYGDTARIELDATDFSRLLDAGTRHQVVAYFKSLGFDGITLDLEGYRMGSLNRDAKT